MNRKYLSHSDVFYPMGACVQERVRSTGRSTRGDARSKARQFVGGASSELLRRSEAGPDLFLETRIAKECAVAAQARRRGMV